MNEIIRKLNTLEEIEDNVRASTPTEIKEFEDELSINDIFNEEEEIL